MMGKIIACSLSWADMPGFFNLFGLLVSACSRRKGCIAGSGAKARLADLAGLGHYLGCNKSSHPSTRKG